VGLAGLVGAGRSEILETLYGARPAATGRVTVHGKPVRRGSIASAVGHGIGRAAEERKSQGLLLDEPVYRNITLSTFSRFARGGFLDEHAERTAAREQIAALHLAPDDPDRSIRTLSGGNQQKAMLARWLVHRSEEHTSELQSRFDLVCRLLLEKKKTQESTTHALDTTSYN